MSSMHENLNILDLPDVVFEKILLYLTYDEMAKARIVSQRFNEFCQRLLNRGFAQAVQFHAKCFKEVKSQLPRRESKRPNHPLARHNNILNAIETRLSLLKMTYCKYIHYNVCCFIPGKVIDELFHVLHLVNETRGHHIPHEVLTELRDISSMAMDYFEEKIVPNLKKITSSQKRLSSSSSMSQMSLLPDLSSPPQFGESSASHEGLGRSSLNSIISDAGGGGSSLFPFADDLLDREMRGAFVNLSPPDRLSELQSCPSSTSGAASGGSMQLVPVPAETLKSLVAAIKDSKAKKSKLERSVSLLQAKVVEVSRKLQDQDRTIAEQARLLSEHCVRFTHHNARLNEIVNCSVHADVLDLQAASASLLQDGDMDDRSLFCEDLPCCSSSPAGRKRPRARDIDLNCPHVVDPDQKEKLDEKYENDENVHAEAKKIRVESGRQIKSSTDFESGKLHVDACQCSEGSHVCKQDSSPKFSPGSTDLPSKIGLPCDSDAQLESTTRACKDKTDSVPSSPSLLITRDGSPALTREDKEANVSCCSGESPGFLKSTAIDHSSVAVDQRSKKHSCSDDLSTQRLTSPASTSCPIASKSQEQEALLLSGEIDDYPAITRRSTPRSKFSPSRSLRSHFRVGKPRTLLKRLQKKRTVRPSTGGSGLLKPTKLQIELLREIIKRERNLKKLHTSLMSQTLRAFGSSPRLVTSPGSMSVVTHPPLLRTPEGRFIFIRGAGDSSITSEGVDPPAGEDTKGVKAAKGADNDQSGYAECCAGTQASPNLSSPSLVRSAAHTPRATSAVGLENLDSLSCDLHSPTRRVWTSLTPPGGSSLPSSLFQELSLSNRGPISLHNRDFTSLSNRESTLLSNRDSSLSNRESTPLNTSGTSLLSNRVSTSLNANDATLLSNRDFSPLSTLDLTSLSDWDTAPFDRPSTSSEQSSSSHHPTPSGSAACRYLTSTVQASRAIANSCRQRRATLGQKFARFKSQVNREATHTDAEQTHERNSLPPSAAVQALDELRSAEGTENSLCVQEPSTPEISQGSDREDREKSEKI